MKKLFLILTCVSLTLSLTQAQEIKTFEIKNFKGRVEITGPSSNLIIEGYNGKNIILSAESTGEKIPEKAEGLRLVTAGGVDNTGLGINTRIESIKTVKIDNEKIGENFEVLKISIPNDNKLFKNHKIKIPNTLYTVFKENNAGYWGSDGMLHISGLSGELEVNCYNCKLNISNFSGNLISNNSSGITTVEFDKLSQEKISTIKTYGDLEVIMPKNSQANLKTNTYSGNLYTDFDLVKAEQKTDPLSKSPTLGMLFNNEFRFLDGDSINIDLDNDAIKVIGENSSIILKNNNLNDNTNIKIKRIFKQNNDPLKEVIVEGKPMDATKPIEDIQKTIGNIQEQRTKTLDSNLQELDKQLNILDKKAYDLNEIVVKGYNSRNLSGYFNAAAYGRNLRTDRYDYTINGGGVYLELSSNSGNIYLRKK